VQFGRHASLRDENSRWRDQICAKDNVGWGVDGAGERRRLAKRAGLLRGDHVGFEIDASAFATPAP